MGAAPTKPVHPPLFEDHPFFTLPLDVLKLCIPRTVVKSYTRHEVKEIDYEKRVIKTVLKPFQLFLPDELMDELNAQTASELEKNHQEVTNEEPEDENQDEERIVVSIPDLISLMSTCKNLRTMLLPLVRLYNVKRGLDGFWWNRGEWLDPTFVVVFFLCIEQDGSFSARVIRIEDRFLQLGSYKERIKLHGTWKTLGNLLQLEYSKNESYENSIVTFGSYYWIPYETFQLHFEKQNVTHDSNSETESFSVSIVNPDMEKLSNMEYYSKFLSLTSPSPFTSVSPENMGLRPQDLNIQKFLNLFPEQP
eukprot:TRINITY_DN6058_c0_g1_i2.p1 TRINITY_DN6058_c0_g1~~TRINITY_DN6058_c0_g1_i2.p1  ORF type:complete len:307 (-),score=55.54 TRINITY_DN6058_c0_g1_i2:167-1087(-)